MHQGGKEQDANATARKTREGGNQNSVAFTHIPINETEKTLCTIKLC